jgi:hypothetical protein
VQTNPKDWFKPIFARSILLVLNAVNYKEQHQPSHQRFNQLLWRLHKFSAISGCYDLREQNQISKWMVETLVTITAGPIFDPQINAVISRLEAERRRPAIPITTATHLHTPSTDSRSLRTRDH